MKSKLPPGVTNIVAYLSIGPLPSLFLNFWTPCHLAFGVPFSLNADVTCECSLGERPGHDGPRRPPLLQQETPGQDPDEGRGVDDVLLAGEHAHEGRVVGVPVGEGLPGQLIDPVG